MDIRERAVDLTKDLPAAKLSNLKELLELYDEYSEKVVYPEDKSAKYVPSDDELIMWKIGEKISLIINSTTPDELKHYLVKNDIKKQHIKYHSYEGETYEEKQEVVWFFGEPGETRDTGTFGDYTPKTSPDTVYDYIGKVEDYETYYKVLTELPIAELDNLKLLLELFNEYSGKAKTNAGRYEQGNMVLGGPEQEYLPTGDELVLAEVGKKIKYVVEHNTKESLQEYLKSNKLDKIEFNYFEFYHMDVMGSGRFIYSSDPIKTEVVLQ
ncbi:hypothetical protein ACFLZN_01875 [Nanoarchaeota archaeon]